MEALARPADGAGGSGQDRITLAAFDHHDGLKFDLLRRAVRAGSWTRVTEAEVSPRGMTPLFDAIARIVSLAWSAAPERGLIVIMTDGEETASREVTKQGARAALDRARARGWEVVFLGAEFGRFADAEAVGVTGPEAMAGSAGSMQRSMRRLASRSRSYFAKGKPVHFDAEDREEAGEQDVKRCNGS